MKKQQLFPRDHHMRCAANTMVNGNANISVENVASHIKLRIVMCCILARLQKAGEHQIKGELEEIGRETEVGETTEVRREVLIDEVREVMIDGVNRLNMVGETNPLTPLETEFKE